MKWLFVFFLVVLAMAYLFRGELMVRARHEADERYHWSRIRAVADTTGLDPIFLASTVYVESKFNARAVSPVGAVGLMQLMPATAREVGKAHGIVLTDTRQLMDPDTNLLLGAWYLHRLIDRFGDTWLAIAAYNGGPNAVGRWLERSEGGDTDLASFNKEETREYVRAIGESYSRLRRVQGVWRWIRDHL